MTKKFDAIVFDLGGVLYNIDTELSVQAFEKLGLKNFQELYSLASQSDLFDALETGAIDEQTFAENINLLAGTKLSNEAIHYAWNSLLIGLKEDAIPHLIALKDKYQLYLLSNTNTIHMDKINNEVSALYPSKNLADFFNQAFYSFNLGLRKPGPEIYNYVTQNIGISPDKILFIDDNTDNISSGQKAGWQAYRMEKNSNLTSFLKSLDLIN